jgi:hypothetical protein
MTMKKALATLALTAGVIGGTAAHADARAVQVDGPTHEVIHHNYITYHTHIKGMNKTYIELRDGSEWVATPCRAEDSRNCWWNAKVRGIGGQGHSFLNIRGNYHYER